MLLISTVYRKYVKYFNSVITELCFKINKALFKNLLAQTSSYLEFCLNFPNEGGNYHCYDRDHGVF